MPLKFSYSSQIHKVSKLPKTFKELNETINYLFEGKLPSNWALRYIDSDGDAIMLSDEEDYKNLLEEESASGSKSIKVNIIQVEDSNGLNSTYDVLTSKVVNQIQNQDNKEIEKADEPLEESKMVQEPIKEEKQAEEEDEEETTRPLEASGFIQNMAESKDAFPFDQAVSIYQVQGEKPKQAEKDVPEQRDEEIRPESIVQSQNNVDFQQIRHRVKKIIKKLVKKNLSELKKEKLQDELQELENKLTPEQREQLEKKKDKYIRKITEKEAKIEAKIKKMMQDMFNENLEKFYSLKKNDIQEEHIIKVEEDQIQIQKAQEEEEKQQQQQPLILVCQVVHEMISCNGCNESPIVGIRYKCTECPNFNYCEKCEVDLDHPHPFIKLRKPEKNPLEKVQIPVVLDELQECFDDVKKWAPFLKNIQDFWKTECCKAFIDVFLGNNEDKDGRVSKATIEAISKLFESLPQETQEQAVQKYRDLPQKAKKRINECFLDLPQKILGGQVLEEKQAEEEEKIQEPVIEKPKEQKIENNKPENVQEEVKVEEEQRDIDIEDKFKMAADQLLKYPGPKDVIIKDGQKDVQKEDPFKKYPEEIKGKVQKLKEIFPEADVGDLYEFVFQTPNAEIAALVENYLQRQIENNF
jgi:hypothetical protein